MRFPWSRSEPAEATLAGLLDECLTAIERGDTTLERALAAYPAEAEQLRPLLLAALSTRQALAVPAPSAALRARVRARVRDATAARPAPLPRRPLWQPAMAAGMAMFLLLALAVPVTLADSDDAVPGDWNYGLKRAGERVRLATTLDDDDRRAVHLALARRRGRELEVVLQQNRTEYLPQAVRAVNQEVEALGQLVDESIPAAAAVEIAEVAKRQEAVLLQAVEQAPEPVRPSAQAAASNAGATRAAAAQVVERADPGRAAELAKSPTALPPAQARQTTPAPTRPPAAATPTVTAAAAPAGTPTPTPEKPETPTPAAASATPTAVPTPAPTAAATPTAPSSTVTPTVVATPAATATLPAPASPSATAALPSPATTAAPSASPRPTVPTQTPPIAAALTPSATAPAAVAPAASSPGPVGVPATTPARVPTPSPTPPATVEPVASSRGSTTAPRPADLPPVPTPSRTAQATPSPIPVAAAPTAIPPRSLTPGALPAGTATPGAALSPQTPLLQPGANVLVYVGSGPITLTTLLAPLNGLYSAAVLLNPGGVEIAYTPGTGASPLVLTNARIVVAMIRPAPVPPGLQLGSFR